MDTVGSSSFNGHGGLAFNLRLEFRQILPLSLKGSTPRFVEAQMWWTGTFGVNGSDRFRREAAQMTAEFVKDYAQANQGMR